MIHKFEGIYTFDNNTVARLNPKIIGVYYCGVKNMEGRLLPYYIGKSVADGGIRGRLLQHLSEKKWPDVTHFGYVQCDFIKETEQFELTEIARCKPKYNTQGK